MATLRNLLNYRQKFNVYLDNEEIDSVNKMESFFLNKLICITSMNFDDYCQVNGRTNRTRERLSILYCIIGWMAFLRFLLAAFVDDSKIWILIGDPFYLIKDRILFNLLVAAVALNSTSMRSCFIIGSVY